jgi:hypothetical protein
LDIIPFGWRFDSFLSSKKALHLDSRVCMWRYFFFSFTVHNKNSCWKSLKRHPFRLVPNIREETSDDRRQQLMYMLHEGMKRAADR